MVEKRVLFSSRYLSFYHGKDRSAQIGTLALIIPVIIYMWYVSIEAWCLGYAFKYWSGGMQSIVSAAQESVLADGKIDAGIQAVQNYLLHFAGVIPENDSIQSGNFRILRQFTQGSLPFLLFCFTINFILIYRGINRGIEWFCRWAMPALLFCAILILVRVLTLGTPNPANPDASILNGLGFMWNPVGHNLHDDSLVQVSFWEALARPQTWLAAAGQIFFSLCRLWNHYDLCLVYKAHR